jgi:alpha,alpha-trehalase
MGFRLPVWILLSLSAGAALGARAGAQPQGPGYPVPPSVTYGRFYADVELASIFSDSKTFPDMIPASAPKAILHDYDAGKTSSGFELGTFVGRQFAGPVPPGPDVGPAQRGEKLRDYVEDLWPVLRQSTTVVPPFSSLLPLPYPYVVPGGRFREVYYWDSYFTMLALEEDGRHELALGMLKDFAYEIDQYGHIPNGNRSYYLSRSQPPFFALMVELIARHDGDAVYHVYLPEMRAEYDYWMQDEDRVLPGRAMRHVVRLLDGTVLNRYWDDRDTPRDESYEQDVHTASGASRPATEVWRNLRAAAESGWDFSSRWLADGKNLSTTRTTSLLPPDLNSLLAHVEETLSKAYAQENDAVYAETYRRRAKIRVAAIRRLMWDAEDGVFTDYLWAEDKTTCSVTAATLFPLFLGLASADQAGMVARTVSNHLLRPGGLATTLVESGQQWDAPNGWAPLQWVAVVGLRNYGYDAIAEQIARRWVSENIAGYQHEAKLVEKYNVETNRGEAGGGGEYATQIGFGWTNSVLLALASLYPELQAVVAAAKFSPQ